jgi:Fic family protein
MDLTPAFFDRWREHRGLDYLDRVREVIDVAALDDDWLERVRLSALAREAAATLRLAGAAVDEEEIIAVVDRGESADVARDDVVRAYASAHRVALDAATQQAAVTPALLRHLHGLLLGGAATSASAGGEAALAALCDWLAAPPGELRPAVVAAVAELELLRARPWPDGNARLARLVLLLLLVREGYAYRGLLAPSPHWSDPRKLPDRPAEELSPKQAETLPGVEHLVHCVVLAVRDLVIRARSEEGGGSLREMAFGWPIQP